MAKWRKCGSCGGTGRLDCEWCDGSGYDGEEPCQDCLAIGYDNCWECDGEGGWYDE